jgi:hypothetical protein
MDFVSRISYVDNNAVALKRSYLDSFGRNPVFSSATRRRASCISMDKA